MQSLQQRLLQMRQASVTKLAKESTSKYIIHSLGGVHASKTKYVITQAWKTRYVMRPGTHDVDLAYQLQESGGNEEKPGRSFMSAPW